MELQEKSPGYSEEKAIEYMSNDHALMMGGSIRNPVDTLCMEECETNAEIAERIEKQQKAEKLKTNEARNGVYSKLNKNA